jgi:nitrogen fixation protein NifU and related proteins
MNIYQAEILDKYNNPQHMGQPEQFTHSYRLENLSCGDEVEVYLQVSGDELHGMQYMGEGCVISLAAAETMAEVLVGKKIVEILQLDWQDVVKLLKIELTASRIKCAHLSLEAVQKALQTKPAATLSQSS